MATTITIGVSISPVSASDNRGGTVNVRIPLVDPETGEPRTRAELYVAAVKRACTRVYGRTAFWWADNGLPGYGQVMRPCNTGGSDAITYRARLDVEIPPLPDHHRAALAERAARYDAETREMEADRAAGYAAYREGARCPRDRNFYFEDGWRDAQANAEAEAEMRARD